MCTYETTAGLQPYAVCPGTAVADRFGMLQEASRVTICWECEAATSQPIAVTIEMTTRHRPRVQLCPSCYRSCYLLLIAETTIDGAHEAPTPPSFGTTSTHRG